MSSSILEVKNARVYRGQTCVFENLNLHIQEGENIAILGPNGAGKTTLLKLLTRELSPVVQENAHVKLFGKEHINIWQLREKIGVVSHEFQAQYEAVATGLDVVISAFFGSVGLHQHQHVTEAQVKLAEQSLERFHITELRDRQFLQLSSGQKRRLLLARATIHNPQVVIFDEPTSSLDVSAAFQILNDMRALIAQNKTVILVTHHIQEILPEINRVVIIDRGEIRYDGNKKDVLTSQDMSALFHTNIHVSEKNGFYQWVPAND